jgi:hypothetical protein
VRHVVWGSHRTSVDADGPTAAGIALGHDYRDHGDHRSDLDPASSSDRAYTLFANRDPALRGVSSAARLP